MGGECSAGKLKKAESLDRRMIKCHTGEIILVQLSPKSMYFFEFKIVDSMRKMYKQYIISNAH